MPLSEGLKLSLDAQLRAKKPGYKFNDQELALAQDKADALGVSLADLLSSMNIESGFNPKAKNPYSSATGLLQWTEPVAKEMGTSTKEIAKMPSKQQLNLVEQYLKPKLEKLKKPTFSDLYSAILHPEAVGKPDSHIMIDETLTPNTYDINSPLDLDGNGQITKGEAAKAVKDKFGFSGRYRSPEINPEPLAPKGSPWFRLE